MQLGALELPRRERAEALLGAARPTAVQSGRGNVQGLHAQRGVPAWLNQSLFRWVLAFWLSRANAEQGLSAVAWERNRRGGCQVGGLLSAVSQAQRGRLHVRRLSLACPLCSALRQST
jgi:hypothetical protein